MKIQKKYANVSKHVEYMCEEGVKGHEPNVQPGGGSTLRT